ncbi:MAG: L-2-amino-thiazoline-4-carboxylic acid hydrolase [Hyalangium sp.]|uniref:L-2-amino-thiazoline-4-carboxylic acid hydrolase n=1 Tax=Hyalangium sp. TaxID=2028555 RepID=UPI0038998C0D
MTTKPEPSLNQIYQWWWMHDGRWYQEVAKRFGFDAANEINREALKFVASRVARGYAKSLGRPVQEMELAEAVSAFTMCSKLMWPPEMIEFKVDLTGPGSFELNVVRNFALQMLQRAGTLADYKCPCLAMREGWFEGLGLKPVEHEVKQCLREGGSACTFVTRLEGFGPKAEAKPSAEQEK